MQVISQSKLARKLLLLAVLTGTLVYLRTPTAAHANLGGCLTACATQDAICIHDCKGVQSCLTNCATQDKACIAFCNS
jgi:hypothetical protein